MAKKYIEYETYRAIQDKHCGPSFGTGWGNQMEEAIVCWFAAEVPKSAVILDIGCGEGRGVMALNRLGFSNVTGIDISSDKVAKGRHRGLNLMEGDFHFLPTYNEKSVDYIFASHCLEHSLDLEIAFKTLTTVTRSIVYFIVPTEDVRWDARKPNSAHCSPIENAKTISDILDRLKLGYDLWEKSRIGHEIWGKIYCK